MTSRPPLRSTRRKCRHRGRDCMWGILPIGSSILAMLFLLIPDERKRYQPEAEAETVRQPAGRGPGAGEDTLVMRGWLLALTIVVVTAILIIVGTLWPVQTAIAMAAPRLMGELIIAAGRGPEPAAGRSAGETGMRLMPRWPTSPSSPQADFIRDLTGSYTSLRSYASLEGFDLSPLHASADEARFRANSELVERGRNFSGRARAAGRQRRRPLAGGMAHQSGAEAAAASDSGQLSALGRDLSRRRR